MIDSRLYGIMLEAASRNIKKFIFNNESRKHCFAVRKTSKSSGNLGESNAENVHNCNVSRTGNIPKGGLKHHVLGDAIGIALVLGGESARLAPTVSTESGLTYNRIPCSLYYHPWTDGRFRTKYLYAVLPLLARCLNITSGHFIECRTNERSCMREAGCIAK